MVGSRDLVMQVQQVQQVASRDCRVKCTLGNEPNPGQLSSAQPVAHPVVK